jgi:hypothetical protein
MMNLQVAQTILISSVLLLANCLAFAIAGAGQALLAKYFGDSTAEEAGYISLNPFAHIDLLGIVLISWCGFGWVSNVPINPHNIRNPWRSLKLLLIYGIESILAFGLSVITALLFLKFFAPESLLPGLFLFFSSASSFSTFATFYPQHSSWVIVIALFLLAFISATVLVTTLSFFFNSFRLIVALIMEQDSLFFYQHQLLLTIVPLLVMIFYIGKLQTLVLYGLLLTIHTVFSLLGA